MSGNLNATRRHFLALLFTGALSILIFVSLFPVPSFSAPTILWATEGVTVFDSTPTYNYGGMVSDGSGGAIISWLDYSSISNPIIRAQRVDTNGNLIWATNGMTVFTISGTIEGPLITDDNSGGAIIAWGQQNISGNRGFYAQRVDPGGNLLWGANGKLVGTPESILGFGFANLKIISDGSGGAIISWKHHWNSLSADLVAQRIDQSGNRQWVPGPAIAGWQNFPNGYYTMNGDGAGGALFLWMSPKVPGYVGTWWDLYAQKLGPAGNRLWTINGVHGVTVCAAANDAYAHDQEQLIASDSGSVIYTWFEFSRVGEPNTSAIYAQKINSAGNTVWGTEGLPVCTASGQRQYPKMLRDGSGGAFICWQDSRGAPGIQNTYLQRVDTNGNLLWATNGVRVVSNETTLMAGNYMVSNGSGGAFIFWRDYTLRAVCAQKIDPDGNMPWWASHSAYGFPLRTSSPAKPTMELVGAVGAGTGKAIVIWGEVRTQGVNNAIVVQKIADILPVVTLEAPTAPGITLYGGTSYIISWEAANTMIFPTSEYISIYLTTNEGVTWTPLTISEQNDPLSVSGTFEWIVPNVNSTHCRISIEARDIDGIKDYDISPLFELDAVFNLPPVVTLEAPTALGITLDAGTRYIISWEATDDVAFPVSNYISIYLITNEGLNRTPITISEQNDPLSVSGTFEWIVPNISSINCRISIEARDFEGFKAYDMSPPFELNGTWILIDDLRVDDKAGHAIISRQPRVLAVISAKYGSNTISSIRISIDGHNYFYSSPESISKIFDYGTGGLDFTSPIKFPPGTYTVTVKAWDNKGYMTEASAGGLVVSAAPDEPVLTDMAADPVIIPAGTSQTIKLAYVLNSDFDLNIILRPTLPPFNQLFRKICYAGGPGGSYGYNEFPVGPLPPLSSGGYDILIVYDNKVIKSFAVEAK